MGSFKVPARGVAEQANLSHLWANNSVMWEEEDEQLVRVFRFNNFVDAFAFMTKVALTAEKLDHHPNWSNSYNEVTIRLSTHEAEDTITDKDHFLAAAIDNIYGD